MTSSTLTPQRYHSLDALRAAMMLLGLILHTGLNYVQMPIDVWPYKDSSTHLFFDVLIMLIHLFRMPVFFVVAGFFAALLYEKRGAGDMLKNRILRILLPLLLSYVIIAPLSKMAFSFAMNDNGESLWKIAIGLFSVFPAFMGGHLIHLWFLYYLVLLYVSALLLLPILSRLQRLMPLYIQNTLYAYLVHNRAIPVLSLLTFLTLIPMAGSTLDSSFSWIPAPHLLLAYGVFFAYGWLLYRQRQGLKRFQHHWKMYLLSGLSVFTLYFFVAMASPFTGLADIHLPAKALAALIIWLMIYASIGLFERFLSKPNPYIRYLSDASYWMYLLHLPVVLVLVKLVAPLSLSAFIKFSIVLSGTFIFSLLTYYLFIRSTAIGALLNGRRYTRALPQLTKELLKASV